MRKFIKEMYAGKSFPVLSAARKDTLSVSGDDERARDPSFRLEHGYRSLFATPCTQSRIRRRNTDHNRDFLSALDQSQPDR